MEDEQNIFIDDVIATVVPGSPLQATLASVALAGTGSVTTASSASFSSTVERFASRYYEVTVDPAVANVAAPVHRGSRSHQQLFQSGPDRYDRRGTGDLPHRLASAYTKRFPTMTGRCRTPEDRAGGTGAASAGPFTVTASSAAAAPDVMVTRWHTVIKREYEIDSRNWAWTWVSPDIFVDNDLDGAADGEVFFSFDNKLHIRLHNKGNQAAAGIGVEFWYQDASGGLATAWLPVVNTGGVTQTLTGLSLPAGASQTFVGRLVSGAVGQEPALLRAGHRLRPRRSEHGQQACALELRQRRREKAPRELGSMRRSSRATSPSTWLLATSARGRCPGCPLRSRAVPLGTSVEQQCRVRLERRRR